MGSTKQAAQPATDNTNSGAAANTSNKSAGDKVLAAAVEQLKAGANVPGFTLIPVKKVKGNHRVEDTGEVIERGGVKFAVCTVEG